jgi:hypothetical protein
MKNAIKIISIVIILAITSVNLKAQNNAGKTDDLGRIVLNTYVSDGKKNAF